MLRTWIKIPSMPQVGNNYFLRTLCILQKPFKAVLSFESVATTKITSYSSIFSPLKRTSTFQCKLLWKRLTFPRSIMKQSPLLKLAQVKGTSVALTTLRPLIWKSLWALRSLVTTWLNPEATPPAWIKTQNTKLYFISLNLPFCCSWEASRKEFMQ